MDLNVDKITKILLGAIALGLFLNLSNVLIDKAYAIDWDVVVELNKSNVKIDRMQENLNIIDKNVRVLEKIIDTAESNLKAAIKNACNVPNSITIRPSYCVVDNNMNHHIHTLSPLLLPNFKRTLYR